MRNIQKRAPKNVLAAQVILESEPDRIKRGGALQASGKYRGKYSGKYIPGEYFKGKNMPEFLGH